MRREFSAGGVVVRRPRGSFFLFRYSRGRVGDIPPARAHEVAATAWLPLDEAPTLLAHKGSGRWPPGRSTV
jgi:hypothetical protein